MRHATAYIYIYPSELNVYLSLQEMEHLKKIRFLVRSQSFERSPFNGPKPSETTFWNIKSILKYFRKFLKHSGKFNIPFWNILQHSQILWVLSAISALCSQLFSHKKSICVTIFFHIQTKPFRTILLQQSEIFMVVDGGLTYCITSEGMQWWIAKL